MQEYCRSHGVQLAPHGKTTMSPTLISRQIEHGAWGITVANAVQARTLFDYGVRRILIANQLINETAINWAFEAVSQGLTLYCFVDSQEGLKRLKRPKRLNSPHTEGISVLVEIGGFGGRGGTRKFSDAAALAEQAKAIDSVRCVGVAGYEGVFKTDASDALPSVRSYLRDLADSFTRLANLGLFDIDHEPIISAGGSAHFDDVVDICGPVAQRHNAQLVLRSGCYVTHDHGIYQRVSPLRNQQPLQPALEAIAQVTSRPEPNLALLDIGKRDVSFDEGLPVPLWRQHVGEQGNQRNRVPPSWRVSKLMDQHTFLKIDPNDQLNVGDLISFGISHPCTTFDKWTHIPEVADNGTIVDVLTTEF
ncbi:MAG: amino acid deaminase [Acidimicrobiia bacterium]|nr:amino acid deaminase [Acidimicrobiia bacterium]